MNKSQKIFSKITLILLFATACESANQTKKPALQPTDTIQPTATLPNITPSPESTQPLPTNTFVPTQLTEYTCPNNTENTYTFPTMKITKDLDMLEEYIYDYLNTTGSPENLETELSELIVENTDFGEYPLLAKVSLEDVTGNGVQEVLVEGNIGLPFMAVMNRSWQENDSLFIFTCINEEYQLIHRFEATNLGHEPDYLGLIVIEDFNNNGISDLAIKVRDFQGPVCCNTSIKVYVVEWDGTEFVHLIKEVNFDEYFTYNPTLILNGKVNIGDSNNNGLLEIILEGGKIIIPVNGSSWVESGPRRNRVERWEWDGESIVLINSQYDPPEYRFQAIQDADTALIAGNLDKALEFYQLAIYDPDLLGFDLFQFVQDYLNNPISPTITPNPDPGEWSRLAAYARYRIILIHLLNDDINSATIVYETLQDNFVEGVSGYEYTQLAAIFWENYLNTNSVEWACNEAVDYAASHEEEILQPLGSRKYGFMNGDYYPIDICPFGTD